MAHLTPAMEKILAAVVLAPSAHNTQPWKFAATENRLDIFVDWNRHLKVSDPTNRQLYVSLGCAMANAVIAARHENYQPESTHFPEGSAKNQPVARLTLTRHSADSQSATDVAVAIKQRRTDRSRYDGKPLTPAERQALNANQDESIILVEQPAGIKRIAQLTEQATQATLSRQDFKEELSHWVRNSWTRQPDGMPGYAMGIPAPISLLAPLMVRLAPIHKQEGPKVRQQVESSSAVVVIATPTDTPTDWLKAGQLLEQLWLSATAADLAAAPVVATVEAEESIRRQLQQEARTNRYPQTVIRVGHSKEHNLKATPRRSVADCLSA